MAQIAITTFMFTLPVVSLVTRSVHLPPTNRGVAADIRLSIRYTQTKQFAASTLTKQATSSPHYAEKARTSSSQIKPTYKQKSR